MPAIPRITVVTPSYNQAEFLEQTILSVLDQNYPDLEYFIYDGGSMDGSVDIIKRHSAGITYWQSEKDGGQAAALNAAFARSTGDILCWLNSDDYFYPGTLQRIAASLDPGTAGLIYGDCRFFWEKSEGERFVEPPDYDADLLEIWDYIVQPSAFWTRTLWEKCGPLREDLDFAFDWDWWLRARHHGRLEKYSGLLSAYRFHEAHKSSQGSGARGREIRGVFEQHAGPASRRLAETARLRRSAIARYESLLSRLSHRIPFSRAIARALTPGLWDFSGNLDHLCLCAKVANA